MKSTDVLIIGAGPSGMISALCLAKLGISCIIVERNSAINEHPKAHELNTRSIEILQELGFAEEAFVAEASPISDGAKILFCNTINEEFGRIDLEADEERREKYKRHLQSSRPYLNISQTALEKIILKKVESTPQIELCFDHAWQSLEEKDSFIESDILHKSESESFRIRSQFVIAADGAGSPCREFLGIKMEGPDNIQDFASAYFESNLRSHVKTAAKLYWILNPFAAGTFIAHHMEKRWVYMLPAYLEYQKKEDFTKTFFEKRIKTALGNPDLAIEIKSINFWRMSAQIAERYREGRILLVGDAAHRFPPTGGLGMNTGIADAHNISWKIAAVLSAKASLDFLDSYELERRPIAAQNTEESLQNFHKILEVPEAFGLGREGLEKMAKFRASTPGKFLPEFLKEALIRLVTSLAERKLKKYYKDPTLKAKVEESIAEQMPHFDRIGLDIGYIYKNGAIISDSNTPPLAQNRVMDYIPSTHPGARFPHIDLSTSKQYDSTHDFIGYEHFTLIIREKGQTWEKAYRQFIQKDITELSLIKLAELNLPSVNYEELCKQLEIEADGALLIRPDGHIAFRSKSLAHSSINFSHLFNLIFQKKLIQEV
ncbi:MAG: FAD-dependent monooxygenase [Bacteroidota bacterium]